MTPTRPLPPRNKTRSSPKTRMNVGLVLRCADAPPVTAQKLAHGRAAAGPGQDFIFFFAGFVHGMPPLSVPYQIVRFSAAHEERSGHSRASRCAKNWIPFPRE